MTNKKYSSRTWHIIMYTHVHPMMSQNIITNNIGQEWQLLSQKTACIRYSGLLADKLASCTSFLSAECHSYRGMKNWVTLELVKGLYWENYVRTSPKQHNLCGTHHNWTWVPHKLCCLGEFIFTCHEPIGSGQRRDSYKHLKMHWIDETLKKEVKCIPTTNQQKVTVA